MVSVIIDIIVAIVILLACIFGYKWVSKKEKQLESGAMSEEEKIKTTAKATKWTVAIYGVAIVALLIGCGICYALIIG